MQPYFNILSNKIDALESEVNSFDGDLSNFKDSSNTNINNLQKQINNIVAGAGTEGSSSAEILQARVNVMSKTFPTLNERISFIENSMPFKFQNVSNIDFNDFVTPRKIYCYFNR